MARQKWLRRDFALVLTCMALYVGSAAQVRTPHGSSLSLAVTTLARPVTRAVDLVGDQWQGIRERQRNLHVTVVELAELRQEAAELRRTNQLLTAEVASMRQGSRLLAAFPSLLDKAFTAQVIAREILSTRTIRLDRGHRDGVRIDAPVLAEGGLLGRIDRVWPNSCRVQLLSHPQAAAAARIAGVAQEALLFGGEQAKLTGLPPYTEVAQGAAVVTSGSEGIYPPGLLLGFTETAKSEGLFTVVPVKLAASPSEVTVVLILKAAERSPS